MIEFDNEGRSVSCLAFSVFFPVLFSRGFFYKINKNYNKTFTIKIRKQVRKYQRKEALFF